jgi:hypothetical protein
MFGCNIRVNYISSTFQVHTDHHACLPALQHKHFASQVVPVFGKSLAQQKHINTLEKNMYASHCAHYSPAHTAGTYNIL